MSPRATDPVDLELLGPTSPLEIQWADGHRSSFPPSHLRTWCPCAECTDHGATPLSQRLARHFSDQQLRIQEVREVGAYGLAILWGDGHAYGIYSWDHLRSICPCPSCLVPAGRAA